MDAREFEFDFILAATKQQADALWDTIYAWADSDAADSVYIGGGYHPVMQLSLWQRVKLAWEVLRG